MYVLKKTCDICLFTASPGKRKLKPSKNKATTSDLYPLAEQRFN